MAVGEEQEPQIAVEQQNGDEQASAAPNSVKKKRRKKRRWKPYHKLSLEEKRELEMRQQERAERTRADRFAHGQPMAPYNTTQFLLEDYEARQAEEAAADELDQHPKPGRVRTRSESYAGSEISEGSWPSASAGGLGHSYDSSDSFEREFELEYEREQAERMEKLTRDDLIRENAQLCDELAKEKDENRKLREENQHLVGQLAEKTAATPERPATSEKSVDVNSAQFDVGDTV